LKRETWDVFLYHHQILQFSIPELVILFGREPIWYTLSLSLKNYHSFSPYLALVERTQRSNLYKTNSAKSEEKSKPKSNCVKGSKPQMALMQPPWSCPWPHAITTDLQELTKGKTLIWKQIHTQGVKSGWSSNMFVGIALIDLYYKICGGSGCRVVVVVIVGW